MDYRQNNVPLWQTAVSCVQFLDSTLPTGHRLYVFDNCGKKFVNMHAEKRGNCAPFRHGKTNIIPMLSDLNRLQKEDARPGALVLFSDFQTCDSVLMDSIIKLSSETMPVLCVKIPRHDPFNYSVTSAFSYSGNTSVRCSISAKGKLLTNAIVSVNHGRLRTGHAIANVGPDTSAAITIENSRQSTETPLEVRLESSDPFVHDNTAYLAPTGGSTVKIMLIAENETCFPVNAALKSLLSPIEYSIYRRDARTVSLDALDSADIIIFSSVSRPSRSLTAFLKQRSTTGKAVIFSPALDAAEGSFDSQVLRLFKKPLSVKRSSKPLFPLLPDTASFIWQGFPRLEDRSVKINAHLDLPPGTVLARLSNGKAFLTSSKDSAGRHWIFCTAPIGIDTSNNLMETGFYVPFIDRILRYGLLSINKNREQWIAGKARMNPFQGSKTGAMVYDAAGTLAAQWTTQSFVMFGMPGAYRVQPSDRPSYWITAISDPEESDLRYAPPNVPENAQSRIKVIDEQDFREFVLSSKGDSKTNLLWIILAALIISEVILWEKKKNTTDKPLPPSRS
jgi:hypothetical protein